MIAMLTLAQAWGETYSALWKQAQVAQQKDQPKTELKVMQSIIDKATLDGSYGHLLAAEFRSVFLLGNISPDSIAPAAKRLEKKAAETADPTLAAVWHAALGKLYKSNATQVVLDDEDRFADGGVYDANQKRQQEHFAKALENPQLLAAQTSVAYAPLTTSGFDGTSFKHDMLHVVGFEADTKEAYQLMHDYYAQAGMRGAACLCAFKLVQMGRQDYAWGMNKSKYLQSVDSLIHVYQDIPEAGEAAVEHYRFMAQAKDVSALDKLNYINYALSRWGGWSRMNVLRNAQKQLTEPMFRTDYFPTVLRPGQKAWLKLDAVRNLGSVTLSVSRLNITADNNYDVNDAATYKMLLKKTTALHQVEVTKRFAGRPNYEVLKDSFEISGLRLGAYLMEITTDNAAVPAERYLFYVSDLALMKQQLPDNSHRYVVVNATTGHPIAGAEICIYDENHQQKRTVHARLKTDANGEATYKNVDGNFLVTTATDKYTPAKYIYLSRGRYYEQKNTVYTTNIYTDRAIYRPGQTVHATAVCFSRDKGVETKAVAGKEVSFSLRDANNKVVSEKTVRTDEYGTASADFELPQGGLTGYYHIQTAESGKRFRVEEYKRPTFEITFPKVNQKYTWGDTVVVKAMAKTYSGVPVQGAKVSYTVKRRSQLWWWANRTSDMHIKQAEAVTGQDGSFDVEIPLVAVEGGDDLNEFMAKTRFFSFDVQATVTDLGGESHEGSMSLPIGTKEAVLSSDLPEQIERDSLKQMTLNYRNSSGMDIAATARYRIDKQEWMSAGTNQPINLKEYPRPLLSGVHTLEAICGRDTLQQEFVLFSMTDGRPVKKTPHWFYQTANQFPQDGKPVYVQVGSSENGVHVVYSLIAGNKLLEKGFWELSDSIMTRSFTYKPEYETGVVLNYSFVKNGVCYGWAMCSIERPLPDKRLNVKWKTFRDRLTPGQKEEWTLQVTTPDGRPAKAQLMSVLYDKSLDQLQKHLWSMNLGLYQSLPNCEWRNNLGFRRFVLGASYPTKYYDQNELEVDGFDAKWFPLAYSYFSVKNAYSKQRLMMSAAPAPAPLMAKSAAVTEESMAFDMVLDEKVVVGSVDTRGQDGGDAATEETLDNVSLRENLAETAFFYPALETNSQGMVSLKFTLPESTTTWRFMGLAHDKDMRNGLLTAEAVAQKTIMVQPNLPRFIREGDKAQLTAKLFNTAEKKVSGNVRMQLVDPETNKVVWQRTQKFDVEAEGTATATFEMEKVKEGIYIYKVVAEAGGYSDGEQHYLPVLGNRELVTNTLPFTLHEQGEQTLDLSRLFLDKKGKQVKDARVTIEYANNPSWLMIQALPTVSNPTDDNALSLMAAVYSNSIARHIMQQSPVIKQVVQLWKQELADGKTETTLMSALEKNQELKQFVLSETPWVMAAEKEADQKSQLVNYFDESLCNQRLATFLAKLNLLQREDGSFSWWKNMPGSRYMTTAVAEMMVRLTRMVGKQNELSAPYTKALSYLQRQAAKEVKEMKKLEAKGKEVMPSEEALHYLYILSLDGKKLNDDAEYLLAKMAKTTCSFTIYGKAKSAVILAKNNYKRQAQDYLKSIHEYSVYSEEMGRYFDTRKAYYSWRDYKIPTQVAAIEALQLLSPEKGQEIEEMQRWLLQSKRTQGWDTPLNAVDAVYAFMNGNVTVLDKEADNATLKLDGKQVVLSKATAGVGYVKAAKDGVAKTLTVDKKDGKTSWGAVYAQYQLPASEIASAASGISVKRVVETEGKAEVGKKIKVKLLIKADRDYDFVQLSDKRAGCLEPVNQASGYNWDGYYIAPKDFATNYYFDRLSKGSHVIETEYYIDRKGDYQAGTCTVQCAYSPEFGGRAEAYHLEVK